MVNGKLRCLGTPQQLKSKYGQGYKLNIRFGPADREGLMSKIVEMFPEAVIGVRRTHSIIVHVLSVHIIAI